MLSKLQQVELQPLRPWPAIKSIYTGPSSDGKCITSSCTTTGPDGSKYYHWVSYSGRYEFDTRKATHGGISKTSEPETPEYVRAFLKDKLVEYYGRH